MLSQPRHSPEEIKDKLKVGDRVVSRQGSF